ncbi:hypothetical protein CORC01_01254 [Colletotrichum orchidophilum]|uniref:Uncharacterized protein n=1 Tax=Colletotrichum orchidophilum TaxID=1209926 RepID=A0A1G4BQC4_9PEZI|nr:uncharacterized protein CORC01_01254 [Colletotrichum orchidophilum]OHF03535.1 hypothetical protein CORC01_01254 [Colletotrichum orchidophilum]
MMSHSSGQSSLGSPPTKENPIITVDIAPRVAVELKDDWTEARANSAFLLHPTTKPFRPLSKGAAALATLNQKPKGPAGNPLITIKPVQMTEDGLAYMLHGIDEELDIPAQFLRIGIRIVKDFGPGVPEFDNMTPKTSTHAARSKNHSFKAGDMAVCDHFAINIPEIIKIKKLKSNINSGYDVSNVEHSIPCDFVQYGLQMGGPITVKSNFSTW